jgi:threonine 3-dehydrogenase
MLQAMNYGGQIAILGIPSGEVSLDLTQIILKGLKIKGIYGREMFETWYKMTSMLQSRLNIAQVITHRFGVDDFLQAFEVMHSGRSGKVILDWR